MTIANAVGSYNPKKLYELVEAMSLTGKISISLLMALTIGVLAQIRVFLPWTPVPVVMTQIGLVTFAAFMGKKWGVVPALMYVLGGAAGIPWFSGFGSGVSYFWGPTGGYLIGYVLSSLFIAHLCNVKGIKGRMIPLFIVIAFSQFIIIFLPGLLQLNVWLKVTGAETIGIQGLLSMGLYPFIIGDVIKTITATLIVYSTGRK